MSRDSVELLKVSRISFALWSIVDVLENTDWIEAILDSDLQVIAISKKVSNVLEFFTIFSIKSRCSQSIKVLTILWVNEKCFLLGHKHYLILTNLYSQKAGI